jgi:hypothetical protein
MSGYPECAGDLPEPVYLSQILLRDEPESKPGTQMPWGRCPTTI